MIDEASLKEAVRRFPHVIMTVRVNDMLYAPKWQTADALAPFVSAIQREYRLIQREYRLIRRQAS